MILFNCQNRKGLTYALKHVTLAALMEYKEMSLRNGLPTRADEIKHYFQGAMPTETEVSLMFQLTEIDFCEKYNSIYYLLFMKSNEQMR